MIHLLYLLIEFIDELVFGVTDATWPLIRTDLGLTYTQIGLAMRLPGLISNFICSTLLRDYLSTFRRPI